MVQVDKMQQDGNDEEEEEDEDEHEEKGNIDGVSDAEEEEARATI